MPGDSNERKTKRKKKSKFGVYLYAITIIVLTVVNLTIAMLLLTHVQNIQVVGNELSKKEDIIAWIREDKFTTNSLYTTLKFKTGSYKLPIYLKSATVRLTAPWKIKVKVEEKEIIGSVVEGNEYVYFDEEGLVLKKGFEYDASVPIIEGLQVEEAEQFQYLKVENKKVFSYIVEITKEIQKNKLNPDHIVWAEDSMNLHFGEISARLGKSNFGKKIVELSAIIEKLEGKHGIIYMEHYTSGRISFKENVEE